MRPDIVEVFEPRRNDDVCLGTTGEPFRSQAFVSELAL